MVWKNNADYFSQYNNINYSTDIKRTLKANTTTTTLVRC